MRGALLALLILAPVAAAVDDPAIFALDLVDEEGDVLDFQGRPVRRPSADILNFSSRLAGDDLRLYIRVGAPPTAPNDSIEIRLWFKHSVNGSFDAVDLGVHGAMDPADRLESLLRRDRYENVTYIPARYGIEQGSLWIFSFNASLLAGADCFTPDISADSSPKPREGPQGFDALSRTDDAACTRGAEPEWAFPDPVVPSFGFPTPTPEPEPPGSAPTPAPAAPLVALAFVAAAALALRAQRQKL